MKKIIQVISDSHTGGGQTHLINLLQNINKNEFKIITIADSEGHYVEDFKLFSERVYLIDFKKNMFVVGYKIFKIFRKEKPDIVHNHLLRACLISAAAGLFAGGPKIINNLHGGIEDGLPSGNMKVYLYYSIYRILSKLGVINLCVSKSNMEKLKEKNVKGKFAVIYNGIKDIFQGTTKDTPAISENQIVTIARLHPAKGIETLISSSQQVYHKCKFSVIGDGPLFENLQEKIEKLKIKNFHLLGFKKQVKEYLEAADIFVLSSNWEAFPISVVEAMAASKPVISTNVGGVSEVITDGLGGFIVDIGDSASIAKRIDYLLDHPEERIAMGKQNRKVFEEILTYDTMIKNYESLYNNDFSLYSNI